MDPIDALLAEHREIMEQIAELRRAVGELGARGEAAVPDAMPVLQATGAMMAGRLLLHATKEDVALFPAMEAAFGTAEGPTTAMREEHQAIHREAERFRRTLHELNQVEHPAIEQRGAELRALAAAGQGAKRLQEIGIEIIRLLGDHFEKEETILFPMARTLLDPDARRRVMEEMNRLESR
jgi:regulator of cell morphogenesis and NO signaling